MAQLGVGDSQHMPGAVPFNSISKVADDNAARGVVTQDWLCAWSIAKICEAGPRYERACEDDMGRTCPKLADARARQALAERQVVEINHRVLNVLQLIATLIARERRKQDDPSREDNLEGLSARIQAIAALHRHLLPPRTLAHVDLAILLQDVAAAFASVTGSVCEVDAEPVTVPGQVAMQLATAVNELAWNVYKHAYQGKAGGAIKIVCQREAEAGLRLSVADRGCGLPVDFDPYASEGLGLMVVGATVRQFSGELEVQSDQGARFTLLLTIPRV